MHMDNKALIAIGEMGLDHKYEAAWEKQSEAFNAMLRLAEKLDLPVIIHSRGTTAEIVDILTSYRLPGVLLYWFSNPASLLPKAVENGYYISEGVSTIYSKGIHKVVSRVLLTSLLTETDGPVRFLDSPFDGKMTASAFLLAVVKAIAEIKKMNISDVAEQVTKNFEGFFRAKLN